MVLEAQQRLMQVLAVAVTSMCRLLTKVMSVLLLASSNIYTLVHHLDASHFVGSLSHHVLRFFVTLQVLQLAAVRTLLIS